MYEGKLSRLRSLEPEDAERIFKYWNNYEIRQQLTTPLPVSKEDMKDFVNTKRLNFQNKTEFMFGIEDLKTSTLIGIINLEKISWLSRHGQVGLFSVFHPDFMGRGYGRDSLTLLLDFAFQVLDFEIIYLWVLDFNIRAIELYRKIGFQESGKIRQLVYRNGKRHDVVSMDILKSEFVDKYSKSLKDSETISSDSKI